MTPVLIALMLVALSVAPARGAPGDPRLVDGTLVWPPALGTERVIILRDDDGRVFYGDITSARRLTAGPITAGMRLAFAGVEGAHARLVIATAFGTGITAAPTPPIATARPVTASASAGRGERTPTDGVIGASRIHGVIREADGRSLVVQTSDGDIVTIDVSGLRDIPATVSPGATVDVIAVPTELTLKAAGFAAPRRR